MTANLVFLVGGATFHPATEQAKVIREWLSDEYTCNLYDGVVAFDHLDDCDLLVAMGSHWTGMTEEWAGGLDYHPMTEAHEAAYEAYVRSGKPLLAFHGGICSYDDNPRFTELLGFAWVWGESNHPPYGEFQVEVLPTGHPILSGIENYTLPDELYSNIRITPSMEPQIHAYAVNEGQQQPMIVTVEGGRVDGAGRTVFLANGHDMKTLSAPIMQPLFLNAVRWLLAE